MSTDALRNLYRTSTVTEQAALLTAIVEEAENPHPTPPTAQAPVLSPQDPRCPACNQTLTEVIALNLSVIQTTVVINGAVAVDQPAFIGDYHVTHYVTACCSAGIHFDPAFTVIVS